MKIALIGWYGHNNAGDDRILFALRSFFQSHDFLITSGFKDALERIDQINQCDYVLIGGGGLILRGTGQYSGLIDRIKPRMSCVGISIEALHKDNIDFIDAIKQKAEIIYVRDLNSCVLLGANQKVIVGPDLTFLYPYDPKKLSHKEICGLNLREWHYANLEHLGKLSTGIKHLDKRFPKLKKFYPFSKWEPERLVRTLGRLFVSVLPIPLYTEPNRNNDIKILKNYFNDVPTTFSTDTYNQARYFIGMRLHSLIFACQMGIPFLSLSYQPKNKEFCKSIGLNASVNLYNLNNLEYLIKNMKENYFEIREHLLDYTSEQNKHAWKIMRDISKVVLFK